MTKKLTALTLSFFLIIVFGMSAMAESKAETFAAYKEWIQNGAKSSADDEDVHYDKFCLLNLDKDSVPELISCRIVNDGIYDFYIQSFKDGQLVILTTQAGVGGAGGFRGTVSYIAGKGLIRSHSWGSANPQNYEEICKLTSTGYKVKGEGEYLYYFDDKPIKDAVWNGKNVSSKVYEKKSNKAFNEKKGKDMTKLNFVSASEILEQLK